MRVLVLLVVASPLAQDRPFELDHSTRADAPPLLTGQEKPQAKALAIRGARLYPGSGSPLEHAVVLIEGAKIAAIGKDVPIPPDTTLLEASGKVIIPGLIDAASRLFLEAGDRGPGSAEQSVLDSVDRYQDLYKEALEQGVTVVYVGPPSTGPVNGLGAVLHLDRARTVLAKDSALKLSLGLAPGDTSTVAQRYESYVQLKQAFEGAKQYGEMWEKYRKDFSEWEQKKPLEPDRKPAKPKIESRNEVLLRALDAKQPLLVRIEVHTIDAIGFALRLIDEFKLRAALEGATEAYLAAENVKRAGVSVVAGPVIRSGPPSVDLLHHSSANAAVLAKVGVPVVIGSFGADGGGATRFLAESAALAASYGLTREQALAAITSEAAKVLGLEKAHGSLEKGKSADLVILSGEPFEVGTVVEKVLLDGEVVFQRKGE